MNAALVIGEHDETVLTEGSRSCVAAAGQLGLERVDLLLLGQDIRELVESAAETSAADSVLSLQNKLNAPYLAAIWSPQIAMIAANYSHVLAPATTFGKDLLPRVAAELGTGMLSDVIGIEDSRCFRRPVFAGNAIERVRADASRQLCMSIRPAAFPPQASAGRAAIEQVTLDLGLPQHTRFHSRKPGMTSGPDLQTAATVVAGGRGLGSREEFEKLAELASLLDAALGASRAAVDSGWAPNDLQIGQTGKIIAPDLYIAIGISGAIQHLTGIKDAGTIVAINNDADAPVCGLADIVLLADLFEAVPELISALGN